MAKVILIHANCCNPTASGDFIFAGNLAKDLKIELKESDIDVFLVSALDGIPRFEKLYGKANEGRVLVDGVSVGLSSLEKFDAVEYKVIAFIDANRCKHSAEDIVKRVISPKTKFLFVGNVNQPALSNLFSQTLYSMRIKNEQPGIYNAFDEHDMLIGSAGFGSDRLGIPKINKTVELPILNDEKKELWPTVNYGFMYVAAVNGVKDYQLMAQYMKLTGFENYVLVGDFSSVKTNIESAYRLDKNFSSLDNSKTLPTIQYYDSLHNPIMRRMVANSTGSLVVSTGVTSTLEAMRDEKLAFYQDLSCNEQFVASYLMAVKSIASSDVSLIGNMPEFIIELSSLLFAPKPLSHHEMIRTKNLLEMSSVQTRLIAANQAILDQASGKIAPRLLSFITCPRNTQDSVQLAHVCASLRKPEEINSPVYEQALRRAAALGLLFELKVLIRAMSPEDLNKTDPTYKMAALHFAVKYKHIDCAQVLINAGVNINAQAKDGKTSLHWAAMNSDREMIKLLIHAGSAIDKIDNSSKKPEECAPDNETTLFIKQCYEESHVKSCCLLS